MARQDARAPDLHRRGEQPLFDGERGDEGEILGPPVRGRIGEQPRDFPADPADDLVARHAAGVLEGGNHESVGVLAAFAEDDAVGDERRGLEALLDGLGVELLPAKQAGEVRAPAREVKEPVAIHAADIACVQPAVAQGGGGLLLPPPITRHDAVAAQEEFAFEILAAPPGVILEGVVASTPGKDPGRHPSR